MSISQQAQEFLSSNLPVDTDNKLKSENMPLLREKTAQAYQPAIDYAISNYVGRLENETVNGIECLCIYPETLNLEFKNCQLLYFFGGAYIQGSPEEDLAISAFISKKLGIKVISPYYRLAPENPYPAAIDDGIAVYRKLLESMNANQLLVAGESAGGNLALQVIHSAQENKMPLPAACALLSPWCDLSHSGDSEISNDGRDPSLTRSYCVDGAQLFAGMLPVDSQKLSPLLFNYGSDFPPTLITSGTRDLLLSQAVRLSTQLRQSGNPVELRIWEEMWHVFEFYPTLPESIKSLTEISLFLQSHLRN